MKNEAHARIKINQLLEEAEWRFFDNEQGSANILLENHVKITQTEVDAWGNDFEKVKSGSLDFLLVDSNNKPICVLEAKKEILNLDIITIYQHYDCSIEWKVSDWLFAWKWTEFKTHFELVISKLDKNEVFELKKMKKDLNLGIQ